MPARIGKIRKEMTRLRSVKYAPRRAVGKYPVLSVMEGTHEVKYSVGVKSMYHKAVVEGEITKGKPQKRYLVQVQFFDVDYSPDMKEGYIEGESTDKRKVYFKKLTVIGNQVKLKCQCEDFRFYWEKELYDDKGLIGNWRRYTRKTPPPPVGRPFVNELGLLGMCKHLHNMMEYLKKKGYLR